jgi:hypothetical protein
VLATNTLSGAILFPRLFSRGSIEACRKAIDESNTTPGDIFAPE